MFKKPYSKSYDFVPFALPSRYCYSVPWLTVGHRYTPLHNRPLALLTVYHRPLALLTVHHRPLRSLTVSHRSSPLLAVTGKFF